MKFRLLLFVSVLRHAASEGSPALPEDRQLDGRQLMTRRSNSSSSVARRLSKKMWKENECPELDQSSMQIDGPELAKVTIQRALHLPKLKGKWGGTDVPDAYVKYKVHIGASSLDAMSKPIKNEHNPTWDDFECSFPVPKDEDIEIDGVLVDFSSSRPDEKIGKFKLDVKYKTVISKSIKLEDCPSCKDDQPDAEVTLKVKWGRAEAQKNKGKGNKGGGIPPIVWVIGAVLLLLVCAGLVGAAIMMNKPPAEKHDNRQRLTNQSNMQRLTSPSPLQECEMRLPPQACHNYQQYPPPWNPPHSRDMQMPQMPPSQAMRYAGSGGGGGTVTVEVGLSGPTGFQTVAREVRHY